MKNLLLVFALLLSGLCLQAQNRTHLEVGLKGGLNVADLAQDNVENDVRLSFNGGGFVHLHIAKNFAIQPELLYTSQGAKNNAGNIDTEIRLGYFAVPVLLQYMTNTGFRIETGPQIGALVSAKHIVEGVKTDIKDNLKDIDFSWAFGVSYLTKSRFGINARYNLGLSDINAIDNAPSIKNRVFQVGLFYQFKAL